MTPSTSLPATATAPCSSGIVDRSSLAISSWISPMIAARLAGSGASLLE